MKPEKRLAHRVVAGRVFVMDPKSGTLHSLSDTATFIWKELCRGAEDTAIARGLAREFEVGEDAALRDVRAFVKELRGMGLLAEDE